MAELETESGLARQLELVREQQRAVSEVLRIVARFEGLQSVLDEVIAAARRLCHGESAQLHLVDGDLLRLVAASGVPGDAFDFDSEHPHTRDRTTTAGRVALTAEVVHIPDVLADPEYSWPGQELVGYRAMVGVPVFVDGELIGTIGVARHVAGAFSDDEVALLTTFADQAAIAIKNARLLDALQRQLEQQRAIGDVLRSIARSEGLQTVLDEIVETVTRFAGGDNVRMWLVREGMLHAVANGGWEDGWEYDKAHPHPIDSGSASGRAAVTKQPVHIPDITGDPHYDYDGPVTFGANLSVPILLDDEVIGVFGIVHREARPFSDDVIELVRTFADQAAVAIANARLIDAVERQLEEQRAVSETLRAVAEGGGLQPVLDAIVEAAKRLCRGEHAQLYLVDGEFLRIFSQSSDMNESYDFAREHPHPRDRTTVVGRVSLSGEVEQIPDVLADPDYVYEGQALVGYRALLGVPVAREGELIGAIAVGRNEPGPFADDLIGLVKTFADEAAVAITNARLIDAVERQLEQQRAISDVLGAVARGEGLEPVLHALVESACRLCDAQFGEVHLAEGDLLRLAVGHGGPPELYEFEREHPHPIEGDRRSVNGRVLLTQDVVHIPDIVADEEYSWSAANDAGIHVLLGAPLLVEGQLVGVFNIVRTVPRPFGDEEIELLRTFADQGAIAVANARLMDAVERQRAELSRFVSPQVAELVSSGEGEKMLAGHRAYISALFCDLRGFTAFAETAAPEELFDVLGEYHLAIGHLIPEHEGTLEHFAGDGLLVFFNDPVPVEEHELKAIRFALAAQARFAELAESWRKQGIELGLGIGIACGYATLGRIGFEGRYDYGALGPVTNLASRLSSAAAAGQSLISQRVYAAVEDRVEADPGGELELKGFARPVVAYEVRSVVQSSV